MNKENDYESGAPSDRQKRGRLNPADLAVAALATVIPQPTFFFVPNYLIPFLF